MAFFALRMRQGFGGYDVGHEKLIRGVSWLTPIYPSGFFSSLKRKRAMASYVLEVNRNKSVEAL